MKYKQLLCAMVLALLSVQCWAFEKNNKDGIEIEYKIRSTEEGNRTVSVVKCNYAASHIDIPPTVTYLDDNIIYKVVAIDDRAFASLTTRTHLTSVTIPEGVTSIGEQAFYECSLMTSVTIPASVTSIGKEAFYWCKALSSVTFSAGSQLTILAERAFHSTGILSIEIPIGLTSIEKFVFYNCNKLESVTFPDNSPLKKIEESAFHNCKSLTSIAIPDGVTSIGFYAFYICEKLTSVTFSLGSQLDSIGNYAFSNCSALKSIAVPDNVDSIQRGVFYRCEQLAAVTFSASSKLKSIGTEAFYKCSSLPSIEIPFGVTSIGDKAFSCCDLLSSIEIPSGVTSIGDNAFYDCWELTTMTVLGTTPPTLGSGALRPVLCEVLYTPWGSEAGYLEAVNWKDIEIIAGLSADRRNVVVKKGIGIISKNYTSMIAGLNESELTSVDLSAATTIPSGLTSTHFAGLSPNCLVYLPLNGPKGVRNGIYGGAAEKITLTDGEDFYCPKEFKADYISYTRTPKVYASTTSNGWQTIVLPFDATDYETEIGFEGDKKIFPVTTDPEAGGNFWLRSLVTAEKGVVTFESTADGTLKANTPYIISFPGAEFNANSLQDEGAITFTASNCSIPATNNLTTDGDSHSLIGVYQKQAITQGWILNDVNKGAQFDEVTGSTLIEPFYAYFRTNKLPEGESSFPQLLISNKLPTALDEQEETSAGLQVLTTPEGIVIVSSAPGKAAIRNAMGIVVSYLTLEAGSNPVSNLPTGVYFIEGQKFFVQ